MKIPNTKKMSANFFPLVILITVAFAALPAFASSQKEGIKLSGEQREQLLDAQAAYIDKMIQLEAGMERAYNKQDRLMASDTINFQQLREQVKTSSELMAKIEMAEIDALEEISTILDSDQWMWYKKMLRSFEHDMFEAEMMEEFEDDEDCSVTIMPCDEEMEGFTPYSLLLN